MKPATFFFARMLPPTSIRGATSIQAAFVCLGKPKANETDGA